MWDSPSFLFRFILLISLTTGLVAITKSDDEDDEEIMTSVTFNWKIIVVFLIGGLNHNTERSRRSCGCKIYVRE